VDVNLTKNITTKSLKWHNVNKVHQVKKDLANINKTEKELADYLYPYENYPEIMYRGQIFCGKQSEKYILSA